MSPGDAGAHPPFVLTMAYYGGTLAATRCLGQQGVSVVMADAQRIAPAQFSRYLVRRERGPSVRPIEPFLEWLLALGRRRPGQVLYATCDDLAWAFAEHRDALGEHFRLLSPPLSTLSAILDKKSLYERCAEIGIQTPWTRYPTSEEDLDTLARDASFPLIVKPRTQVFLHSLRKGELIHTGADLREEYRLFLGSNRYDARMVAQHPGIDRPIIQEYLSGESIYCISGFCDPSRDLFVARASRKVLQWPRRVGIGICFEDAPVDERLAALIRRLCEVTEFYGVFEAEFVTGSRSEPLLIDFNPRFFGQMGFDHARALPTAYLVYLAALGNAQALRAQVEQARGWRTSSPLLYLHRSSFWVTTTAERLVGRIPARIVPTTSNGERPQVFDFATDRHDWVPGLVDGVMQVALALRHAPVVLRSASGGT